MKYIILKPVSETPCEIEIDETAYREVKLSRNNLFRLLSLEERLDILINNYIEYEYELVIVARMIRFNNEDYFSMGKDKSAINRRIVNLLSAGRMYIDQSIHHLNYIYGKNSSIPIEIEEFILSVYEMNFGYRFMEALSNYLQHRGFPIRGISFPRHQVQGDDKTELFYSVSPYISIASIEEDKQIKSTVLEEMKDFQEDGKIYIKPLMREYIKGMGMIHQKIRDLINADINHWEISIKNIVNQYQSKFGNILSSAGLSLILLDDNDLLIEKTLLSPEFSKKRKDLEKKNRNFNHIHLCYKTD
jgi:hypothetical protein